MRNAGRQALRSAVAIALILFGCAGPAQAHGPTMRVALSGIKPATLTIRSGATVHFHNANTRAGKLTVVADDGSFESPALGRGEGWHHTFETPGTFAVHLAEHPSAKGTIRVVAP